MRKPLQFFQTLTQQVFKATLDSRSDGRSEGRSPENPTSEDTPAIDIWEYAEPAGEEPDPLKRNVLQWRRLISSVRDPLATFPGELVDVVGFVHRTQFDSPEQFTIARHIIRCCLADTVPLGLMVYTSEAAQFAAESWLRVQGRLDVEQIKGEPALVIVPSHIKPIPIPKKCYINGVF